MTSTISSPPFRATPAFCSAISGRESPQYEGLEEIRQSSERAARLTQQILAFGRHHSEDSAPVDPNRLASNLARLLPPLVGEDLSLVTVLAPQRRHGARRPRSPGTGHNEPGAERTRCDAGRGAAHHRHRQRGDRRLRPTRESGASARPLCDLHRARHRQGDRARDPALDLPAVLHHQGERAARAALASRRSTAS